MNIALSDRSADRVCAALGIPVAKLRTLDIRLRAGDVVEVHAVYLVSEEQVEEVAKVLETTNK